jgi:hypothetical protein
MTGQQGRKAVTQEGRRARRPEGHFWLAALLPFCLV